jgi:hypothetical protein
MMGADESVHERRLARAPATAVGSEGSRGVMSGASRFRSPFFFACARALLAANHRPRGPVAAEGGGLCPISLPMPVSTWEAACSSCLTLHHHDFQLTRLWSLGI